VDACGFCQPGIARLARARRAGVYGTGRSQKTPPPNAQRDRLTGDNRARTRLCAILDADFPETVSAHNKLICVAPLG